MWIKGLHPVRGKRGSNAAGIAVGLLLAATLVAEPAGAVEFERMGNDQYIQTLNKAHKAYRAERYEEALALYNLTSRWGDPDSQRFLGIMYLSGLGTDVDLVEGMAWIMLAAKTRRRADLDVLKQARQQVPEEAQDAAEEMAQEMESSFGIKATGMVCKRERLRDSGRKEVQCRRPTGSMSDGDSVEVPVVDSQYYWAIQD
ncbi:MAG: hypothetical protein AAGA23_19650 [Pseudomonadota bacterium]